jgi:hypothetical protein
MVKFRLIWILCLLCFCLPWLGCAKVDTRPAGAPAGKPASETATTARDATAPLGLDSGFEQTPPPAAGPEAGTAGAYVGEDLDALLAKAASMELGRAVNVHITHQRRLDNWLFVVGAPRELNGEPLDYASTRLADQAASGLLDDVFMALARRSDGQWQLLEFSLGATDAPFFDWSERFGIPLSLFSE